MGTPPGRHPPRRGADTSSAPAVDRSAWEWEARHEKVLDFRVVL